MSSRTSRKGGDDIKENTGPLPEVHLVIMGAGGVGKTTLIVQFIQHRFIADYEPTIEDSYRKQLNVDSELVLLDILDTAGQEEYAALKDQYMLTGEGFFLVYNIVDKNTYEEAREFRNQILKIKCTQNVPMVLVGNKADLSANREVSIADAKKYAATINTPLFETSAKDGSNVDEAWIALVREVRKAYPTKGRSNTNKHNQSDSTYRVGDPNGGGCCILQ